MFSSSGCLACLPFASFPSNFCFLPFGIWNTWSLSCATLVYSVPAWTSPRLRGPSGTHTSQGQGFLVPRSCRPSSLPLLSFLLFANVRELFFIDPQNHWYLSCCSSLLLTLCSIEIRYVSQVFRLWLVGVVRVRGDGRLSKVLLVLTTGWVTVAGTHLTTVATPRSRPLPRGWCEGRPASTPQRRRP